MFITADRKEKPSKTINNKQNVKKEEKVNQKKKKKLHDNAGCHIGS